MQRLQRKCADLRQRLGQRDGQVAALQATVRDLQARLAAARAAHPGGAKPVPPPAAAPGRRLSELQSENAELEGRLQDAQADAEGARREASAARRLAASLQRRAPQEAELAPAAAAQAIDRLQKRVKVLEAQNMRLRLAAAAPPLPSDEPGGSALAAAAAAHQQAPASRALVGAAPAAEVAPTPAVAKWEADKRLQRKAASMRARLQEQGAALAAAAAAGGRAREQAQRAERELAQAKATAQELTARLHKAEARADPGAAVPAARAKALHDELTALQLRHDALERQLAAARAAAAPPAAASPRSLAASSLPGSPCGAAPAGPAPRQYKYSPVRYTDADAAAGAGAPPPADHAARLLAAQLERDQAVAQVARLHQRMDALFFDAEHRGAAGAVAAAAGRAAGGAGARERELQDTVALLRAALERTKKGLESGVSSSRYMQAVARCRQLRAQVAALRGAAEEAAPLQERLRAAGREAAEAHVLVSALRGQLRAARQGASEVQRAREAAMNARAAQLERALGERDAQLAALRHSACEEARALLAEGFTPRDLVTQLLEARCVAAGWKKKKKG
jgi:hypothetical protein